MFGFLRNKPLQKNGSEAAFLKRGHRAKKRGPKKRGLTPPRFVVNTHTQGRRKGVLTQRHTTTPLKSYGNFQGRVGQVILHTTHSLTQCGKSHVLLKHSF